MKPLIGAGLALGFSLATADAAQAQSIPFLVDVIAAALQSAGATPKNQSPIVATTRTGQRIDDQAVGVDVIVREQIEQKMLMSPGDIAMLFAGMADLRVQTTSPELGLQAIRIHGFPSQYTRLVSDGAPIYFDRPGGLPLVQIPPMDLDRVEVITGGGSALVGANALAGIINLQTRRPGKESSREFLFSQSNQDATDAVVWLASPETSASRHWSQTFLVSAHKQNERDVDADDWSDIPGYSRGVVRQGLYWNNGQGRLISGTAGATFEKREGGSVVAHQSLESRGVGGVLSGQMPFGRNVLSGTGAMFVQSRTRDFSDGREKDRRAAATIELELHGTASRHAWTAGMGSHWYALRSADPLPSKYSSTRPGIFLHDDMRVASWLLVSGSARFDHDILHGFYVSPRGSALVRGGAWSARFTADRSYFTPSPLTEETEAAGLARLTIVGPLEVATARSLSADLIHQTRVSTVTLKVFWSNIDHPLRVDRATYTLHTDDAPLVTSGIEIAGRARAGLFAVTGTYTFVEARERIDWDVALTPRHSGGLAATVEAKDRGRIGVRIDYTGKQRLDRNPYRSISEPYTVAGLFGEYRIGRWRVFVNAENLTDVRQTNWDPIARPARDVDGRWTVDAWAPLKGRVISAGIRVSF